MARFHLPTIEKEQLENWEKQGIFRKVLEKDGPEGHFGFFEGPPTANGKPGIHHVLSRAFKDIILRYKTMRGFNIDRKAGWDTHGLPVELAVEKELGFTKKQDIEEYGIAEFNKKCKESVWKYLDLWQDMTRRTAFWLDLDDPYVTYENDYIETLWWIFKEIDKKDLLYQGYKVTPHCPRCVTSLSSHELAQGYKDTDDPSVFVRLAIEGKDNEYLLVWTTTPWTLPGNVAVAVGKDVVYARVKPEGSDEVLILAKDRLEAINGEYEVVGELKGSELEGVKYQPLFSTLPSDDEYKDNAHKVYLADFVSTEEGTGLVHIAPAFGEDDAELGKSESLPMILTVDPAGVVTADVPGRGKFFKDSDDDVKADLAARGLLYKEGTYTHSYPFCWRCSTPLLYYAKNSWYIKMEGLKDRLVANNQGINWVPPHIKEGRFGEWLHGIRDWALSRERYWGTPLPIWQCGSCEKKEVMGSFKELDGKAPEKNIYFFQRHGEAESNATDTLICWPEPEHPEHKWGLTNKGRKQVEKSAKTLKDKGIDLIFASDLTRTKETADIIAKKLGLKVEYDERLREIDVGVYNGRSEQEYHAYFNNREDRMTQPIEGGENLRDVRRRMVSFVKGVESRYEGKNILVVSHGDPIWQLEAVMFDGMNDEESWGAPLNHTGTFSERQLKNLPYDDLGHVDVHRPYIDEVRLKCPDCGGVMRRIPDVADVWFDSGAMPFAQWHYPMENKERIDDGRNFPADFISEAIDQTRGWFYTLLAVSTLLGHDEPPYRNVICLGHVLDSKGQKMSKSKGNIVDLWEMFDKHGADAVRFYFFTMNQPGEPKRFDERAVKDITKKVFLILWNVLSFYKMYAGEPKASSAPPPAKHELDKWIQARLAELAGGMTADLEKYEVVDAGRKITDFVNDLSTWYLRRSRDRFKSGTNAEKKEAVKTLGYVLRTLSHLMAPFTPFIADALYQEVGGDKKSVHLDDWPGEKVTGADDPELRAKMELVRIASSVGLERRASVGIPVRQVLAKAKISSNQPFEKWMTDTVAEELNVDVFDAVEVKDVIVEVVLDTEITPELERRGAHRELVRHINELRKRAGLTIKDRVTVHYSTDSGFWKEVFAEHGDALKTDVLADDMKDGKADTEHGKDIETANGKVWVGIIKA